MGYYPFGMMMPGRKYSAGAGYRYGFNGKENDNEVKGEGNQQDYGMRIYDGRLGRFLSVDPIKFDFPELTPYQFATNDPLLNIDIDGLEGRPWYTYDEKYNSTVVSKAPTFYKSATKGFFKTIWSSLTSMQLLPTSKSIQQTVAISIAVENPRQTFNNTKAALRQFGKDLMSPDPAVAGNAFGNGAAVLTETAAGIGIAKAGTTIAKIPQGLLKEEFKVMSQRVVNAAGHISDDIVVQGSRAAGTASIVSDIDIAIKVGADQFDELIAKAFGTPNKGSAWERTMQHAIQTGKIQAGEAGFSTLAKNLKKFLGGMKVDISIVKKGGQFDNGAQIPIKGIKLK